MSRWFKDLAQPNPTENRPEDFLATDAQKALCDDVLRRATEGHWEDVPDPETKRDDVMGGMEVGSSGFQWEGEYVQESAHTEPQRPSNVQVTGGLMDTVMEEDADADEREDDEKTVTGKSSVEVPDHASRQPSGFASRMVSPVLLGGPLGMQTCTCAANSRRAG
ncbi:hypothetical protein LTR10_024076 [Elasticomyces elasticus]|uniref:Uncharacterized protein n=1 Tax=Exophiala sideris TaxID=1016849 RepID=A0ABR0IX97_9EURO|nr:hypothetical protein LTR10_024076 [Elasticomyces elasticus]KAK5022146.1 hypothetical protein LTS07_010396 [Exophiala sideris]KAK5025049.1 hypothetical protein LTR13_010609 [Exophiala sideris]KAK5051143.1 hypothetical protein LTR69_010355 [Exophiala sideris]KAK5176808.1 hypothetical protein LTR44_010629 [Eurotiomycetes sp. CCFEE 6388]